MAKYIIWFEESERRVIMDHELEEYSKKLDFDLGLVLSEGEADMLDEDDNVIGGVYLLEDDNEEEEDDMIDLDNYDDAVVALATHLGVEDDEVALDCLQDALNDKTDGPYGYGVSIEYEGAEYAIMTDYEADTAYNEAVDSYIDECVLEELPERYRGYFNYESFKRDVLMDGRGYWLAPYDDSENEELVRDTWFYIYRTN